VKVLGVSTRSLGSLARLSLAEVGTPRPLLVLGVMADTIARELCTGGDAAFVGRAVDPTASSVVVIGVGGVPRAEDIDALRRATRAGVPLVAVQLDPHAVADVPYVSATSVVACHPGQALPVAEIARTVAASLRPEDSGLADRLPLLRDPFLRHVAGRAAVRAAAIGGLPWFTGQHFPLLAADQLRLSQGIAAARGQRAPSSVSPDLGVVLAVGLAARSVSRRLVRVAPLPRPLVRAAVAVAGTVVIGSIAARRPS
jgi:hypothetical protein